MQHNTFLKYYILHRRRMLNQQQLNKIKTPDKVEPTIIELNDTPIILQNHINYNFYDKDNITFEEQPSFFLNETILYKNITDAGENKKSLAELKDLNPLVYDNIASCAVSGIYYFNYFNECNNNGYLLNLNYINNSWHINNLSIIQKYNDINLYINNGVYYILKTINNSESYLAKVELVKQLPNMNKQIYKSKNKLYEIDINGTVTQLII